MNIYKNMGAISGVNISTFSDNRAAVSFTLSAMKKYALNAATKPEIIMLARRIVGHLPGKHFKDEVIAIRNWVMQNVRYTRDVVFSETLQTPEITISSGHGDCDDQATLTAALLMAIGAPAQFRAIRSPHSGENIAHVLAETFIGGEWRPVETTEPWPPLVYPGELDLRGSIVKRLH